MSRLSDLLNPAPTAERSPIQEINTSIVRHSSHARQQSITSPLQALALAATEAPPILSHAHPTSGPASTLSNERHPIPQSQSPSSGDFAFPTPLIPQLSPSFPTSFEIPPTSQRTRRLSDIADGTSRELPPPTRTLSDDDQTAGTREEHGNSKQDYSQHLPPLNLSTLTATTGTSSSSTTQTGGGFATDRYNIMSPSDSKVKSEPMEDFIDPDMPITSHSYGVSPAKNKSEMGFDGTSFGVQNMASPSLTLNSPTVLPSTETAKKRTAPRSDKKKGTASVIKKPAAKKRKVEPASKDGTPFSQRSTPPASVIAGKPKGRKQNSATPAQSSPQPGGSDVDEEDDEDDSELFCICRKPDDHTWMIGCDGGCEDWFHGHCVNMNERDGNLVDKYICPNCSKKGLGPTTWKPMCRLDGCRQPARVIGSKPSKYCSDAHGRLFMSQHVALEGQQPKEIKRRPAREHDDYSDREATEDEDPSYLNGGIISAGELKALASGVKNIEEFRKLGQGVLSSTEVVDDELEQKITYTPDEAAALERIKARRESANHRLNLFSARETFVAMVKVRAKKVLEDLQKQPDAPRDICGFDERLAWGDEEFDRWRATEEAQAALKRGSFEPASDEKPSATKDEAGDVKMENGSDEHEEPVPDVCLKKRCEQHKAWYTMFRQEGLYEKEGCKQALARIATEERGVKERAKLRSLDSSHS